MRFIRSGLTQCGSEKGVRSRILHCEVVKTIGGEDQSNQCCRYRQGGK